MCSNSVCIDEPVAPPPPGNGGPSDQPWAHNTGPTNRGAIDTWANRGYGSRTITKSGTYENFSASGLTIEADNVTLRNFVVTSGSYGIRSLNGNTGIVIEDGEITAPQGATCLYGGGFTARRLHIHDCWEDGIKTTSNVLVEYSFVEKLGLKGGHTDGNQTIGGSNITFRYNNIFMPVNNSPYRSNANFMLEKSISNFVIDHNWLNGGNHTINTSNITSTVDVAVTNNRFGRDYAYGLKNGSFPVWTGNVWDDTGDPI